MSDKLLDILVAETCDTNPVSLLQQPDGNADSFRQVVGAFDGEDGSAIAAGVFRVPFNFDKPVATERIASNGHEPELTKAAIEKVLGRGAALAAITHHRSGLEVDIPTKS